MSNCLFCNKLNIQSKYCSNKCQKLFEQEQRYVKWINGENEVWKAKRQLKIAVIRLKGYVCAVCGISNWNDKPLTLDLEHIDGNSSNDRAKNLCLICPNCHSQTDTFKNKNRGNGRHNRRMRYKEGKSY